MLIIAPILGLVIAILFTNMISFTEEFLQYFLFKVNQFFCRKLLNCEEFTNRWIVVSSSLICTISVLYSLCLQCYNLFGSSQKYFLQKLAKLGSVFLEMSDCCLMLPSFFFLGNGHVPWMAPEFTLKRMLFSNIVWSSNHIKIPYAKFTRNWTIDSGEDILRLSIGFCSIVIFPLYKRFP